MCTKHLWQNKILQVNFISTKVKLYALNFANILWPFLLWFSYKNFVFIYKLPVHGTYPAYLNIVVLNILTLLDENYKL